MPSETKRVTPVLLVNAIEPCLPLWAKLGWTQIAAAPERDGLPFVILRKYGAELMYQTWQSLEKDLRRKSDRQKPTSVELLIEVSDIGDIERQLLGFPITVSRRRTPSGTHELRITEPGGHTVIFAEPVGLTASIRFDEDRGLT